MSGDACASVLRVAGIVTESPVDGPGLRFTIFTQGCPHNCPGCHNPQTHDPDGGYDMAVDELVAKAAATPLISGVTLTGGEPLAQPRAAGALVRGLKAKGLHVIVYTGYKYEDISQNPSYFDILDSADLLVDGPFVAAQRTLELRFRGSRNQRVINLPATRAGGGVVEVAW